VIHEGGWGAEKEEEWHVLDQIENAFPTSTGGSCRTRGFPIHQWSVPLIEKRNHTERKRRDLPLGAENPTPAEGDDKGISRKGTARRKAAGHRRRHPISKEGSTAPSGKRSLETAFTKEDRKSKNVPLRQVAPEDTPSRGGRGKPACIALLRRR